MWPILRWAAVRVFKDQQMSKRPEKNSEKLWKIFKKQNILRKKDLIKKLSKQNSKQKTFKTKIFQKQIKKRSSEKKFKRQILTTKNLEFFLKKSEDKNYESLFEDYKGVIACDQCPTGRRTRPATRYFFRYLTQPDSVLKIIG